MARTRVFNFVNPRVRSTQIMNLSQDVQLTRLGKIRLGYKKPIASKNVKCRKDNHPNEEICKLCSYPVQTDYFIFDPPEKYPPGIHEALIKEYGEKPTSLQFWFPTENRGLVFPQELKFYKGSLLWCRGDGEKASRIDEQAGGMFSMKCPCPFLGNGCSPQANLMIVLYKIKVHGCFQITTGSLNNIRRTNSFMNELAGDPEFPETVNQSLLRRISYVPCRLTLMPTAVNTPDHKTVMKPLWVFSFDGDGRLAAQLRQRDAIAALMPGQPDLPALPPAPDDRHDEVEDATGPTLDGQVITPPDQRVDLQTGEIPFNEGEEEGLSGEDIEEPGASGAPPPVDLSKSTAPAPGEDPFPGASPPSSHQTPPPSAPPPPATGGGRPSDAFVGAKAFLEGATTNTQLEERWKEHVLKNNVLTIFEKTDLQKIKDAKKKTVKG